MRDSWIEERIAFINGLKSPSDQQRLLAVLWVKEDRSKEDERKIAPLARAERAVERAQKARAEATRLMSREAESERKARTKRLIELGGIVELAGGSEFDKGTLLGMINHGLSATDDEKRQKWKAFGDGVLAEREQARKKRTAAA